MKNHILVVALLFISSGGLYAQNRNLKQVMQMPKTADDELCVTNWDRPCKHKH